MRLLLVLAATAATGIAVLASAMVWGGGSQQLPDGGAATPAQEVAIDILPSRQLALTASQPPEEVLPASFAVRPGTPIRVTVLNYTASAHTFTAEELGISELLPAGKAGAPSKTVFSFVAPRYGVFHWRCALPCGDDGMGGAIYSIVA